MAKKLPIICIFFFKFFFFTGLNPLALAQEMARAKIGVEVISGERSFAAKAKDVIHADNTLRFHVISEQDCYVQIVFTDQENAKMIANIKAQKDQPTIVTSSSKEWNHPAEKLKRACFTIICGIDEVEVKKVSDLFRPGSAPYSLWEGLERELINKSQMILGSASAKPATLGVTTASKKEEAPEKSSGQDLALNAASEFREKEAGEEGAGKPVWSGAHIPTFAAKPFLIKRFNFDVEK